MSRRPRSDEFDEECDAVRNTRLSWMREVHSTGRYSAEQTASPRRSATNGQTNGQTPSRRSAAAVTVPNANTAKGPITGLFASVSAVADAESYASSLKADGVTGALINSVFGEGPLLSVSERCDITAAWASTGMPVVVDVSASSLADTEVLAAAAAAAANIRAITVSVPPVFGGSCSSSDVHGAVRYLSEVAAAAGSTPLLLLATDLPAGAARPSEILVSAASRVPSLSGIVYSAADTNDFPACVAAATAYPQLATFLGGGDTSLLALAVLGATGFVSPFLSAVGPLLAKLTSAAAKGDAATLAKAAPLAGSFFALVDGVAHGSMGRRVAVAKTLAALRLDVEPEHVRTPGPRLTVAEVDALRSEMQRLVANNAKAFGATPAAAAAPASTATTKINVHAQPGFKGELDDKIRACALKCGRAAGVEDILSFLPHLGRKWRKRLPGRDCDLAAFIDHTALKADCTEADITKLTSEAKKHQFFAVCVNGSRVPQCIKQLRGSGVETAAVIGFPLGAMTLDAKAHEAKEIVAMGAAEIDMVMNVGAMKDGNLAYVYDDIRAVVEASRPAIVKVIFETCLLTPEQIMQASILSVAAGAGFLKTATGFNTGGATPEAIDVMLAVAGNECKVKASGGVRNAPDALAYITAGVARIGTSSGIAIVSGSAGTTGY